jgi:hypothetical protein
VRRWAWNCQEGIKSVETTTLKVTSSGDGVSALVFPLSVLVHRHNACRLIISIASLPTYTLCLATAQPSSVPRLRWSHRPVTVLQPVNPPHNVNALNS